jgi:glycolate oxidase iron-sulfur subunit
VQTRIHPDLIGTKDGETADQLLRACVHCGFCNAVCPTYQVLGDEADGPRGRIWLIADLFEHDRPTFTQQRHLDRCLTCRACETACPSGVQYGALLELARPRVEAHLGRSVADRFMRWGLRRIVPRPRVFTRVVRMARRLGPLLPRGWRDQLPPRDPNGGARSIFPAVPDLTPADVPAHTASHDERTVVLLEGCVQRAATPGVNAAARRVLRHLGVRVVAMPRERCCGALPEHLGAPDEARVLARDNVAAAAEQLERGAEAILSTASGCGLAWKDYGKLLEGDGDAEIVHRVAAATRDVGEFILARCDVEALRALPPAPAVPRRIAWQAPCTLQHGQRAHEAVAEVLAAAGAELVPVEAPEACCGSAGSYSLLQPELARDVRERKLAFLLAAKPDAIVTANIGCQLWLAAAGVPVLHWIEWLDLRLAHGRHAGESGDDAAGTRTGETR